jgi:hypothetical protein
VSTTYHLLNPWTQIAARKLGTNEGIWAREVDPSGNRWQVGGAWATDGSEYSFTGNAVYLERGSANRNSGRYCKMGWCKQNCR